MVRVKKLDHVGIYVSDLGRAERFYREIFGMSVVMRLQDQVLLNSGDFNLALFIKPDLSPDQQVIRKPLGKAHHALEVTPEDYKVLLRKFSELKVPTNGPIDWGDHECTYFLDPDGNLLEILFYSKAT